MTVLYALLAYLNTALQHKDIIDWSFLCIMFKSHTHTKKIAQFPLELIHYSNFVKEILDYYAKLPGSICNKNWSFFNWVM